MNVPNRMSDVDLADAFGAAAQAYSDGYSLPQPTTELMVDASAAYVVAKAIGNVFTGR